MTALSLALCLVMCSPALPSPLEDGKSDLERFNGKKRVWVLKAGEFDEKMGKEIEGAAVEFLKGTRK